MKFESLHTMIYTDNDQESIDFYKKALNMVVTKRRDYPEDKFSLIFMATEEGSYEIELTYNHDNRKYQHGTYYGHMAFGTKDFEEAHKLHKEMGIITQDINSLSSSSNPYYFITDPQGFKIEIISRKWKSMHIEVIPLSI